MNEVTGSSGIERIPSAQSPDRVSWALRASIALISASALAYELLLMRWFSMIQWHHFAFMIISLALLGFGASGSFLSLCSNFLARHFSVALVASLFLFALSSVFALALAQRVGFNAEELLWNWRQSLYLALIYLLLMAPFLFAANTIGLCFARYRQQISGIYAADLIGAAFGSLAMVALLYVIFPERAVMVVAMNALVAALCAWWALMRESRAWLIAIGLAGLLLGLMPSAYVNPIYSAYKGLSQALRIPGNRIVHEDSSPLGRISVVESTLTPIRHAPGLSLNASSTLPEQVAVYVDADSLSVINRVDDPVEQRWLSQSTSALPYQFKKLGRVLVPVAGSGGEVLRALHHSVQAIDAVELNPQIVNLVKEGYADYSGRLYERPEVLVHPGDARAFIEREVTRYDLIQFALPDSTSGSGGLHALGESYLYTVESIKSFLAHLNPGGYLAINLWTQLPPRESLKMFATVVQALKELGNSDSQKRLIQIRSWQTATLIVKNGLVNASEIAQIRKFCAEYSFDPVYFPGISAGETNRRNQVLEDYFFLGTQALLGVHSQDFQRDYKFDIRPASDDRPYFFDFFRWKSAPEIVDTLYLGGMSLLESGYLILLSTLLQAMLASGILIIAPLWWLGKKSSAPLKIHVRGRLFAYFFALGIAFMFLEVALIQKFILFLHHPLFAVTTVLTSILLCAGIGSLWSQRLKDAQDQSKGIRIASLAIIAQIALWIFFLPAALAHLIALPYLAKFPIAVVLVAPLGFCMGIPFPLGLRLLASDSSWTVAWAWGINGCASVVSAILASLLAIQFGFSVVMMLAGLLYAIVALRGRVDKDGLLA